MSRRIEVVRGDPTPDEVAALVAALDQAAEADQRSQLVPVLPAWQRAARLESAGGAPAVTPGDLLI